MHSTKLLPGEFVLGYEGRLMALALLNNRKDLYRYLHEVMESRGVNHKSLRDSRLLALGHNLDYQPLVQNHTLIPYHRAVLPARSCNLKFSHGSPFNYTGFPITHLAKQGAWFCPECATEDMALQGLSYWRRFHQVPGISWCEMHERTKLRHVESPTHFSQQPHYFIDQSSPTNYRYQASSEEWEIIHKFTQICLGLLKNAYPMPRDAALDVFAGNHETELPKLLAQYANKTLLSDWLKSSFPDLTVNSMNETARRAFPLSSTSHFALAFALLFSSSEAALDQWQLYYASKRNKQNSSSYLGLCIKLGQ